jgi:hypothetical protein
MHSLQCKETRVHHAAHIAGPTIQMLSRVTAPPAAPVKTADDRFRESMKALLGAAPVTGKNEREQPRQKDAEDAGDKEPSQAPVAQASGDRLPRVVNPKTDATKQVATTDAVPDKKTAGAKDVDSDGDAKETAQAPAQTATDVAAALVQIPVVPVAVEVQPKMRGKNADQLVAPLSAKSLKHDAKKVESATATPVVEGKSDAVAGPVASVTPVAQHAVGAVAGHGVGLVAGHSAQVAPVASGAGVTKSAQGASAALGSGDHSGQATDLKTLVATPNVLEVGIASGSHGWLKVRAEFGQMGEVAASVVASSAGAAEGLHKELPAITAYLEGERVGVGSLVVNAADKGAGAQDSTLNAGTGSGSAGSQAGTGGGDRAAASAASSGIDGGVSEFDADAGFDFSAMNLPAALYANGSGSWLSVRV